MDAKTESIIPSNSLLSKSKKDELIYRGFVGLYRLYSDSSLERKPWSADRSFDWHSISRRHSGPFLRIIEGYYAVEQYTPDYTCELTSLFRQDYGRAQFHLSWGAEEQKHADVWRNVLLASGARSIEAIEQLTDGLRQQHWTPPSKDPIESILYTVLQERATQLTYLNTAAVARGRTPNSTLIEDKDDVLATIALTVAADEAAHYRFFLNGARLFLYYYPEETLRALIAVLHSFVMPAANLIVNYDSFVKDLYAAKIFGRGMYLTDVVQVILEKLGITSIGAIESAIEKTRQTHQGVDFPKLRGINVSITERALQDLFARIGDHEDDVGLSLGGRTCFVQNTW